MSNGDRERRIVEFLKREYHPAVIVLVGSRARGDAQDDSDWDLYVYTNTDEVKGRFVEFENEKLDITLLPVEHLKDQILKNNFSPIAPTSLRILHDDSDGVLDEVLRRTQSAYAKGPLALWKGDYEERRLTLRRQIDKIMRHESNPDVQFIYAGAFYEFAPQVYFERRDMWTPHPVEIFRYFDKNDKTLSRLFHNLRHTSGKKASQVAQAVLKHVENHSS